MPGEPFLTPLNYRANRPHTPAAPAHGYQQFIARSWRRPATCAEVNCEHWRQGWTSVFDETTPLGRQQADYVRFHSGRRFRTSRTPEGWTQFDFHPEQTCFSSGDANHTIAAERDSIGLLLPGDHRAPQYKQARVYDRIDQMVDDFRTHTDIIATARSRAGTGE